MLQPQCGFGADGLQACALGAAYLIHRLIQMAGDMEPIQHVQSLASLGGDELQMASSPFEAEWRGVKMCRKTLGPIKKTATEYGLLTINCHEETLGCDPLGMIEGSTLADEFSTNLRPSHVEARCRRGSRR